MTEREHQPAGVIGRTRKPSDAAVSLCTPAGVFTEWLRATRRAHQTDTDLDVPCGDCAACCASSYFVHIRPDDAKTLRRVPAELLVPTPGAPKGHVVMGYDQHGRCPMLVEGRCSIYEERPLTCRLYDCRVFAAAGVDADRPAIIDRARTRVFDHPTEDDRRAHAAVCAAAAFLRRHPECFVGGARADSPAHRALLAVEVADVFLDAAVGSGASAPGASEADLVAAVLAAHEAFEAVRRSRDPLPQTLEGSRGVP